MLKKTILLLIIMFFLGNCNFVYANNNINIDVGGAVSKHFDPMKIGHEHICAKCNQTYHQPGDSGVDSPGYLKCPYCGHENYQPQLSGGQSTTGNSPQIQSSEDYILVESLIQESRKCPVPIWGDEILVKGSARVYSLKGLIRLYSTILVDTNYRAILDNMKRRGIVADASIEDVYLCCDKIKNVLNKDIMLLTIAPYFAGNEEALKQLSSKVTDKTLVNMIINAKPYKENSGLMSQVTEMFGVKKVNLGPDSQSQFLQKQSFSNLDNESHKSFGEQRSAMLFGNQIEDAADSISVPDANNQNKVIASVAKPQLNFEPCATSAEEFDKTAKLYYVLLNRTALKNFTDVCESSGVTPVICPPSKYIEEMGKVGVIVEPKAKADTMLLETIRNFNGRPLKDVVLIVSVMNLDLKSQKIVEVHEQIKGDFNKCFDTLTKMIKHPFGQRATMFRNIAKTFPGMLEKLPVSDIEANGKIYKQFDSPVVNIQLAAPGMNGEGKHVVLFHDSFVYMFVKYLPKQIRK